MSESVSSSSPTDKNMLSCPYCTYKSKQSGPFNRHLIAHEENRVKYQCNTCGQQFTQKANCYRHEKQHTEKTKITCRFCSKKFHRRDQHNEHLWIHLKKEKKSFECPVDMCNVTCGEWKDIEVHVTTTHGVMKEKSECANCKICGRGYHTLRSLFVHFLVDHDEEKEGTTVRELPRKRAKLDLPKTTEELEQEEDFTQTLLYLMSQTNGGQIPSLLQSIQAPLSVDTTNQLPPILGMSPASTSTSSTPALLPNAQTYFDIKAEIKETKLSPANTISPGLGLFSQGPLSLTSPTPNSASTTSSGVTDDTQDVTNVFRETDIMSLIQQIAQNPYMTLESDDFKHSPTHSPTPDSVTTGEEEEKPSAQEEYNYKCEPCGMLFNDIILFNIHQQLHSNDAPFKCGLCGYEANDKYDFATHTIFTSHNEHEPVNESF